LNRTLSKQKATWEALNKDELAADAAAELDKVRI